MIKETRKVDTLCPNYAADKTATRGDKNGGVPKGLKKFRFPENYKLVYLSVATSAYCPCLVKGRRGKDAIWSMYRSEERRVGKECPV